MDTKHCHNCGETKPISAFYRNRARADGLSVRCKLCHLDTARESMQAARQEFIDARGGVCARCKFSDPRALQIDHIKGGGTAERRAPGWAPRAYLRYILSHPDEFQVLCANCNQIKKHENWEHYTTHREERRNRVINRPADHPSAEEVRNAALNAARPQAILHSVATRKRLAQERYAPCIDCGDTQKPHKTGRCGTCYMRVRRALAKAT